MLGSSGVFIGSSRSAMSAKSTKTAGTWPRHVVLSLPRERKTKIIFFDLISRRGTVGRVRCWWVDCWA